MGRGCFLQLVATQSKQPCSQLQTWESWRSLRSSQELLLLENVALTTLRGKLLDMPVSHNGTQNSIYRSFADKKLQEFAFHAQIRLALRFNLPLVLHIRDVEDALDGGQAEQDCYRILKSANVPKDYPIHRHCFNGQ